MTSIQWNVKIMYLASFYFFWLHEVCFTRLHEQDGEMRSTYGTHRNTDRLLKNTHIKQINVTNINQRTRGLRGKERIALCGPLFSPLPFIFFTIVLSILKKTAFIYLFWLLDIFVKFDIDRRTNFCLHITDRTICM
jgi:hypothetical protein